MSEDKRHLIICNCGDCEHQVILSYYHLDDYPMLCMQFHLRAWEGFFRRLWVGLCFAFGYKSRYGNWDEVIIDKEEALKINKFLADIGYLTTVEMMINGENITTNVKL